MNDFLMHGQMQALSEMDIRMMNPLKLAYLGDAIYEAYVRLYIVSQYTLSPNEMAKKAISYVKASAQSNLIKGIKPLLSDDEWTLVKRGRNQKSATVPKNALLSDYKYATGFEALIGYLYLKGDKDRVYEIIHKGIAFIDSGEKPQYDKVDEEA